MELPLNKKRKKEKGERTELMSIFFGGHPFGLGIEWDD